jgi:uncharacterized protein (DUF2141 family)
MAQEIHDDDDMPKSQPGLWRENHGNLLLALMLAIFLVGAVILFYRQNRFRKPRFPDGSAIQQVKEASETDTLKPGDRGADEELSIVVIGAANSLGSIRLAIYDSLRNFNVPTKATIKLTLPIVDGQATASIPRHELPDQFAVATFHDENGDGELNRNRLGIPTERYGFSRNARGLTGPPTFQQSVIERSKVPRPLEISIR